MKEKKFSLLTKFWRENAGLISDQITEISDQITNHAMCFRFYH